MKAVVVLSGGQDSTTCLFEAIHGMRIAAIHAITFDYGQRHQREITAAAAVVGAARRVAAISHEVIRVPSILAGTSPLVSREELETYTNYDEMTKTIGERVELTFVPMRNPLFLTIAANRARVFGSKVIITGVCQADGTNYPDCTSGFLQSMEYMISMALGESDMRVVAPLLNMTKAESISLAMTLPGCYEALGLSHTAYSGEAAPITQDHATVLREQGFREVGIPDPMIALAYYDIVGRNKRGWEAQTAEPPPLAEARYDMVRELVLRAHNNSVTADLFLRQLAVQLGAAVT